MRFCSDPIAPVNVPELSSVSDAPCGDHTSGLLFRCDTSVSKHVRQDTCLPSNFACEDTIWMPTTIPLTSIQPIQHHSPSYLLGRPQPIKTRPKSPTVKRHCLGPIFLDRKSTRLN